MAPNRLQKFNIKSNILSYLKLLLLYHLPRSNAEHKVSQLYLFWLTVQIWQIQMELSHLRQHVLHCLCMFSHAEQAFSSHVVFHFSNKKLARNNLAQGAATTNELMASIGLIPFSFGQKSCEVSVSEIYLDFLIRKKRQETKKIRPRMRGHRDSVENIQSAWDTLQSPTNMTRLSKQSFSDSKSQIIIFLDKVSRVARLCQTSWPSENRALASSPRSAVGWHIKHAFDSTCRGVYLPDPQSH